MSELLPATASDQEIMAFIDQWVKLLEQARYADALALVEAEPFWTAALLQEMIESYGDAPENRVTLHNDGTAPDGAGRLQPFHQRKEVVWHTQQPDEQAQTGWFDERRGAIWYDLNINGTGSDLTATFALERRGKFLHIVLQDVHVM